jgi:hypothetical protein
MKRIEGAYFQTLTFAFSLQAPISTLSFQALVSNSHFYPPSSHFGPPTSTLPVQVPTSSSHFCSLVSSFKFQVLHFKLQALLNFGDGDGVNAK